MSTPRRSVVKFAVFALVLVLLLAVLTPLLPRAYADERGGHLPSAPLSYAASASKLYLPLLMKGGSQPGPGATNTPLPHPGATNTPVTQPGTSGGLFMNETNETVSPKVAIDASGGIHMAYNTYSTADSPAYYAYCAANCGTISSWSIVNLGGYIENTELALTKSGHPRLLLSDDHDTSNIGTVFWYAACDTGCTTAAGWKIVQAAKNTDIPLPEIELGRSHFAFALDNLDRPRFIFVDNVNGGVDYAYCDASDCTANGAWSTVQLFDTKYDFQQPSLTFTSDGKARLAADVWQLGVSNLVIAYGGCDSACDQPASWILHGLFNGDGAEFVLRLDSQNRPRLALYQQVNGYLFYDMCDTNCSEQANWSWTDIGLAKDQATVMDLALDAQGRPRMAYRDVVNDGLGYAWCNANCTSGAASWQHTLAESDLILAAEFNPPIPANCTASTWADGYRPSLALNSAGNPRVGHEAEQIVSGDNCPSTPPHFQAVRFTFFNNP
ncbi:MAG: hypothetical protein M1570_13805 [Chloroflexi bacterium]|nr:hypothetical protein [Chloroflexota bacterium]